MCIQYGSKTFGFTDYTAINEQYHWSENATSVNSKVFGKAYWKGVYFIPVSWWARNFEWILDDTSISWSINENVIDKLEIIRMKHTTNSVQDISYGIIKCKNTTQPEKG